MNLTEIATGPDARPAALTAAALTIVIGLLLTLRARTRADHAWTRGDWAAAGFLTTAALYTATVTAAVVTRLHAPDVLDVQPWRPIAAATFITIAVAMTFRSVGYDLTALAVPCLVVWVLVAVGTWSLNVLIPATTDDPAAHLVVSTTT